MPVPLSEPPEKKSPWSKYYAERGVSRAPQADNTRPLFQKATRAKKSWADELPPADSADKKPALSAELTAAIAAVTTATAATAGTAFLTAAQKEAVTIELRRRKRLRLVRIGVLVVATAIALPLVATFVFNREPAPAALEAHATKIAAEVLALHSSAEQPLMTAGAVVKPLPRASLGHLSYEVAVTLRLRLPLYVPAQTNGTEAYRMLQRSLFEAQERVSKLRLFRPPAKEPERPAMPLLLQLVHRIDEAVVITVPFEARRFGWRWRLQPADLGGRRVSRTLTGLPLEEYSNRATLIFGSPDSLVEVRRITRLARDYVTTVAKAARDTAVADAPAQESTAPAPAIPGLPDPHAPPLPDPNAPAVPAGKTPALFDPNSPAVPRPK